MAIEITAYLFLQSDSSKAFIATREIDFVAELGEGFSRPVWNMIKSRKRVNKSLVPNSVPTILLDGVNFLLESATGQELGSPEAIAAAMDGRRFILMAFGDSTTLNQVEQLKAQGIDIVLMSGRA